MTPSFVLPILLASLAADPGAMPAAQPAPARHLEAADLTGDGLPELLRLHADGQLSVALNLGQGRFAAPGPALPITPGAIPVVGDLNDDGLADLYLLARGPNQALLGDGQGGLRDATVELGLGDAGHGVRFERVELDGQAPAELMLHNSTGSVLFWARDGAFVRDASTPEVAVGGLTSTSAPGSQAASAGLTPDIHGGLPTTPPQLAALLSALDARYLNEGELEVTGAFDVADGSLTGDDLSDLSVGPQHVRDDAIKGNHIVDGSVEAIDLADDSVGAAELGDGQVLTHHLGSKVVDANALGTGAVGHVHMADDAIKSAQVVDGSLLAADLAVGAVNTVGIEDGGILAVDLAVGAVETTTILDGTIKAADIGPGAVTSNGILDGTVLGQDIGLQQVGTNALALNAVTSTRLAPDSVKSWHISTGEIGSVHLGPNAIDSQHLAAGAVHGEHIASNAVTSAQLAADAVTYWDLADDAVYGNKIADDQIGSEHLQANAVTASHIASNAVGASEIAANAVTSSHIATDAVGPTEIASNAVNADEIEDFGLTGPDVSTTSGDVSHEGGAFHVENDATFGGEIIADSMVSGYSMRVGDGIFSGYYFGGNEGAGISASTLFGPQLELSGSGPPGVFVGSYRMGINTDPHPNYRLKVSGEINCSVISKGSGTFKIDHPLDPENRYLSHSFVESPDMLNLYSGSVVLDALGMAEVTLPEWFEALNRDIHYQLTPVGGFAPLFVAHELQDNAFTIAGGAPGMKVSWMLTGIRQDRFALANPVVVETPKKPEHRGSYLHAEAWGQPPELGEDHFQRLASRRAWEAELRAQGKPVPPQDPERLARYYEELRR